MNFLKNVGTILANLFQVDSCYADFDGECMGQRLGTVAFSLLDPEIEAQWDALENDILI